MLLPPATVRRELRSLPRAAQPRPQIAIHQRGRTEVLPTILRAGRSRARATVLLPGRTGTHRRTLQAGRSPARDPIPPAGRSPGRSRARAIIRQTGRRRLPVTIRRTAAPRQRTAPTAPGRRPTNPAPMRPAAQAVGARSTGADKTALRGVATSGANPDRRLQAPLQFRAARSASRAPANRGVRKSEATGISGCLRAKRTGMPTGRQSMWPLTEEQSTWILEDA